MQATAMSELGQKRRFGVVRVTSASPPKTDIQRKGRDVSKVPNPEVVTHSITSSARARSIGGISRPSVLAVFRLNTSSNLIGWTTGRSAGFAPLRILPT
jgi:hypothetical protein